MTAAALILLLLAETGKSERTGQRFSAYVILKDKIDGPRPGEPTVETLPQWIMMPLWIPDGQN